jgi:hypothetical protein
MKRMVLPGCNAVQFGKPDVSKGHIASIFRTYIRSDLPSFRSACSLFLMAYLWVRTTRRHNPKSSEDFTAVVIKILVLCSFVGGYRRFD